MWSTEIQDKMNKFPDFLGVFSRDTLPKQFKLPMGLIVNTDASTQFGQHWVAIYIDENAFGEYFDSVGLPPFREEFLKFLYCHCDEHVFNNVQIQCPDCITCGEYCCAYLAARFNGLDFPNFINLFTPNTYNNDKLIRHYFSLII
jgi:hypothetical protein